MRLNITFDDGDNKYMKKFRATHWLIIKAY